MYPEFPPIWCSESEVPQLMDIVEKINAITGAQNLLFTMTKTLAIELFKMQNKEVPQEIQEASLSVSEQVCILPFLICNHQDTGRVVAQCTTVQVTLPVDLF